MKFLTNHVRVKDSTLMTEGVFCVSALSELLDVMGKAVDAFCNVLDEEFEKLGIPVVNDDASIESQPVDDCEPVPTSDSTC